MKSLVPAHVVSALFALGGLSSGCAHVKVIPGTQVEDTRANREVLDACEVYRRALEERDAEKLVTLAAPTYWEDSGTPAAADDYGYDGLKQVLFSRLSAVRTLRYNIQYRNVSFEGTRAHVEIRYDASYQMATAMGDRWERKQNDKRLELEKSGGRWLFVAGM